MPNQGSLRRQIQEVEGFQAVPPEGMREPFKPVPLTWTPRLPMGTGGMNTAVSPDAVAPDQGTLLQNIKVNLNEIEPAWGYDNLGAARSSPEPILNINNYKEVDGTAYLVRIDEARLQYWDGTSWTVVTPASGADLSGGDTDRIRSAMVLDALIFVNGKDEARKWVGASTFTVLTADTFQPGSPRFVVGFADRAVFANVTESASSSVRNTQRIEWSASGDETDYTSVGAGGVTLYDAQSTSTADDIMGLTVQGNYLVIVRRNSIWLGMRTGESTAPISFMVSVQGFGTIASNSIADCEAAGFMYLGRDNVYLYRPDTMRQPHAVGMPIRDRLFSVLDTSNLDRVIATYNPQTKEYVLLVPVSGTDYAVRAFIFNVERWANGTYEDTSERPFVWTERVFTDTISAIGSGPVANFTSLSEGEWRLVLGGANGNSWSIDDTFGNDDGTAFTSTFQSPQYTNENKNFQLNRLNIVYRSTSTASATASFSVDGGTTWTDTVTYTIPIAATVREHSLWVPNGILGSSLMFRLQFTGSQTLKLVGYRLGIADRGPILGHRN